MEKPPVAPAAMDGAGVGHRLAPAAPGKRIEMECATAPWFMPRKCSVAAAGNVEVGVESTKSWSVAERSGAPAPPSNVHWTPVAGGGEGVTGGTGDAGGLGVTGAGGSDGLAGFGIPGETGREISPLPSTGTVGGGGTCRRWIRTSVPAPKATVAPTTSAAATPPMIAPRPTTPHYANLAVAV